MSSTEFKSLPVFVYPTVLNFYTNDAISYKQVLTLFNPYEFPIKFKVLCNQPKKYVVVDPEGVIKPKCCVDLVIRHIDVNYMNENITDKLRIQIYKLDDVKNSIGKKDVPLTLLANKLNNPGELNTLNTSFTSHGGGGGNSLNSMMGGMGSNIPQNSSLNSSQTNRNNTENVNYLVIIVGVVCLGFLFLPTIGDTQSSLPKYLHLSSEMKLLAAYILGMVTLAILRY